MQKLILTGWGYKDYATAAAVALRYHQNADVIGVSTRRLPELLGEIGTNYNEIIILGVSLTGNMEVLAKSIDKIIKKKIKIIFITACDIPAEISQDILDKIELYVETNADGITNAVALYYDLPYDELEYLLEDGDSAYHYLLEAAMYSYRNYQDLTAYSNAIRHLANNDNENKWSNSERQMVEHYKRYGNREIIGNSPVISELLNKINLVAPKKNARVMIYGETGTGKETVALQIHNKSPRCHDSFISFNCASANTSLLEARFLGYEKGAFTGALYQKKGIFEQADGGTLFLDEIGELPLEAQGLLLRVLEEGRFTRIGEKEEVCVDVRVITATNRDLPKMVRAGEFREDLFHRLNVIQIRTPSLREHKQDIPKIANSYWWKQYKCRLNKEQIEALMDYDYSGNVRELFNLLERASVLGEKDFGKLIEEHKLMVKNLFKSPEYEYPEKLEDMIKVHVQKLYQKYDKNLSKTAEILEITRNTARKYLD